MQGQVLSVPHPDGIKNKKGAVKKVGCGCVVDGCSGVAFLGRYANYHRRLARPVQPPNPFAPRSAQRALLTPRSCIPGQAIAAVAALKSSL